MTDAIETYANTLIVLVVITVFAILVAIIWYETRQSRKHVEYYRGRAWNEDEGGNGDE